MFMNNNNTNEHPRRLHPHKPELRGPTKTKSLSIIENMEAHKSLSERGTTEDIWQKSNLEQIGIEFFSKDSCDFICFQCDG